MELTTKTGKVVEKQAWWRLSAQLGFVRFEMPVGHPRRDFIKSCVDNQSLLSLVYNLPADKT